MGTRADFYLGRSGMRWLGSIAWDGYPDGLPEPVLAATTPDAFVAAVHAMARERTDWTSPDHGWPWPWNSSHLTDFAYAFDDGRVWMSNFNRAWIAATADPDYDGWPEEPAPDFPDMTEGRSVTFGPRSGVIVIGVPPPDQEPAS